MKLPFNFQSRSGFRIELLASFAGTGWAGIVQLACIPAYIKLVGIESYGLLGFYVVMQAMLQVLDLGLSPTMNREMARYSVQPEKAAEARDLLRTLEIGYWLMGLIIAVGVLSGAHWIALNWIRAGAIPTRTVTQSVMLMGVLAFFQWPVSFYQGGLMGLRHQVLLNSLRAGGATLSNVGGVLILWLVSPHIQALLIWQAGSNALLVTLLAIFLWKKMPKAARPAHFEIGVLRNLQGFALGMTGIAVLSLILTQADKLLVSKLFSLRVFAYYSLAWSVANGPLVIAGCVFNVLFPRMSALVSTGDRIAVSEFYHRGSQLMAVLILPLAVVCSLFSYQALHLWTRNIETAVATAPILCVLIAGSAANALFYLPYALQLASGWTRLSLLSGLAWISILVPLMFPMSKHFGALGAASIWTILNVLNMFIVVPLTHRRLLAFETLKYFSDVGRPLAGVVATATIGRLLFPRTETMRSSFLVLFTVWVASLIVSILLAPRVYGTLRQYFPKVNPSYV